MKSDLTSHLQITSCDAFINAVKKTIEDFKLEKTKLGEQLSLADIESMAAILTYFNQPFAKGEILRDDLKLILRRAYGRFGRFRNSFAKRMEMLRTCPTYNRSALRRGDAIRPHEQVELLKQLAQEREEKQYLLEEKNRLRMELKATTEEHINALADNEQLNQQIVIERANTEALQQQQLQLQERYEELRIIIIQAKLPLPKHHSSVKFTLGRCISDSKIHRNSSKLSFTLFPGSTNISSEPPPSSPIQSRVTPSETYI